MASLLQKSPVLLGSARSAPLRPLALAHGLAAQAARVPAQAQRAPLLRSRHATVVKSSEAKADTDPFESAVAKVVGEKAAPAVVTLSFVALWYALNIAFNLLNKSIFKYFPFPYAVSTVHVVVGTLYCAVMYAVGFKSASFGRAISKEEFGKIFGPATMHAIGHVAANVSFAAVAISLTHTVKTLEPAFNVVLGQLILGEATPLPVILSLLPIMAGVALASAGELSFNWLGFLTAMASNLTFGFRAVLSKMVMSKSLASTSLYAYTTLISVFVCAPFVLVFEAGTLQAGVAAAIKAVGAQRFYTDLAMVGILYHLYNQFAFNTLQRVSPVSHGVCNVVKRVAIIFSSVLFFNQVLTTQALVGTVIALAGTWLYTDMAAKHKTVKPAAA